MIPVKKPKRARRERMLMRVKKSPHTGTAGLVPANSYTDGQMRQRDLNDGDLVFTEIVKPRNPGFHRLVHALGDVVSNNIDEFWGMNGHAVLKRLQLESGAGCEEVAYKVGGLMILQRIPLSLSYESMDQLTFKGVFEQFCLHISQTYWPTMTPVQIADMAELMPETN